MELARLEKEVGPLRLVAPLLSKRKEAADPAKTSSAWARRSSPFGFPQAAVGASGHRTQRLGRRLGRNSQAVALGQRDSWAQGPGINASILRVRNSKSVGDKSHAWVFLLICTGSIETNRFFRA